ncbi:MAG: GNAT family N-acetyltransferase [Sneathiella sp.]
MLQQIAEIESHSLAAIPALRTETYDGWQLRFARNHTRRANSVNVMAPGILPLEEKIDHCEAAYKQEKQPCHFRLTPLADETLDAALAARGYGYFGETEVRVQNLDKEFNSDSGPEIATFDRDNAFWLNGVAALTKQDKVKQVVFREMLTLIDLEIHALAILCGKEIVACGFGVQSSNLLGLFEFAVRPEFRRRGFAARIVHNMMTKAQDAGVSRAYLQVVAENEAGKAFWEKVGFRDILYRYHYRTKS